MSKKTLLVATASSLTFGVVGFGLGALFFNDVATTSTVSQQGTVQAKDYEQVVSELRNARQRIDLLEEQLENTANGSPAKPMSNIPAAGKPKSKSNKSLLTAQKKIAELEAQLAKAKEAAGDLTPEQIAEKKAEALDSFQAAFAKKDGAAALTAMKELRKLGREAYEDLVKVWKQMEDKGWLGLGWRNRRGWGSADLFHWALEGENLANMDPETAKEFKKQSAYLLNWYEEDLTKRGKTFANLLTGLERPQELTAEQKRQQERNRWGGPSDDLYRTSISALARIPSEESSKVLKDVYNDTGLPLDVRQTAIQGLARQRDQDSMNILRRAMNDPDPSIRRSAELGVIRREPPIDGWLVTNITEKGQAENLGIQSGAIIVSYNNKPVRSTNDLTRLRSESKGETTMTIYYRGTTQVVKVQGGQRIGVYGEGISTSKN